jgi:predicted enzyme related to lactoylglutathione lyase
VSIRRVVPNITSDHSERSRDFYVGLFGFDVAMDMGWIVTLVSPSNPTAQISIFPRTESSSEDPHPSLSIEVADVDAVYTRAVEQGLEIVRPLTDEEWRVRRFFVTDPNGLVVNVVSHQEVS